MMCNFVCFTILRHELILFVFPQFSRKFWSLYSRSLLEFVHYCCRSLYTTVAGVWNNTHRSGCHQFKATC